MKTFVTIKNKKIGNDFPVLVIAEVSANHLQKFNNAVGLIKAAKKAGADAVKFQTYTPDTLTIDADNKYFRIKHPRWGGQTLYSLYQKAYTPWNWFKKLNKVADDLGIIFFSTAFDKSAVDLLEEINVPVHKIASFELVDLPLIEYMAKTKKPIIMSTGMATLSEIKEAFETAKRGGAKDIILLKCVSSYPTKPEDMNLKTICDMRQRFKCPVGLSDHSLGIGASIAAISLGANLIEKHFVLSKRARTPDSFFSITPQQLKDLVNNARIAEKAIGNVSYCIGDEEKKSRLLRRSIFITKDIEKGERFTYDNIKSIRPGNGLHPMYIDMVVGKGAKINLKKGSPLKWNMIKHEK